MCLQVFDVVLNGLPVITNMDIYSRAGKAMAHDEVVQFSLEGDQLFVNGDSTAFDGILSIQFAKVGLCRETGKKEKPKFVNDIPHFFSLAGSSRQS